MSAKRSIGVITRGTTAPNRLRRMDRWLLHTECSTLRAATNPVVVDLGYGASPITALELRNRLALNVREDIQVVGIEIDPERVVQAQPLADKTLSFIRGGFEVPVPGQVNVIRAANVLRQYQESEVRDAWQVMCQRLVPGGLLLEGTCDEIGRRSVWVAVRRDEFSNAKPVSLTISTHLQSLTKPSDVAPRLPKILIHRNSPGNKIFDVLQILDDAWERTSHQSSFGARQHWIATLEYATTHGLVTSDSVSRWRLGEVTIPWEVVEPI